MNCRRANTRIHGLPRAFCLGDARQYYFDLKGNIEEEFAKERLQGNVFIGTGYAHPPLGTIKVIEAITLDDVKAFWKTAYTQGALRLGIIGNLKLGIKADAVTITPAAKVFAE